MGYIIKPIVTEKMSKLTDKSSLDKTRTKKGEKYTIPAQPKYGFIVKPEPTRQTSRKRSRLCTALKCWLSTQCAMQASACRATRSRVL
mgnify:CR=1 FL=1